jgi:prepilin peptidase CpaA
LALSVPVLLVFPIAMAFAGAMDLLTMKIPNRISVALVAAFLIAALLSGMPLETLLVDHVLVGAAAFGIALFLWSLNLMGGGDAKLLSAVALWMGYEHIGPYLLEMSILGGVLALAVLAYRIFVPSERLVIAPGWAVRLHAKGTGIPYGLAIAGAALMTFPSTPWFHTLAGI